jgi:hypothetical protein
VKRPGTEKGVKQMIQPAYVMALLIAAFLAAGIIGGQTTAACQSESCFYAMHP